MSNVAIDLTKTVKEIIETMKTAIDNLNTNVDSLKSEVLLAAHPVGSYYISDKATDPGTLFGGTWKMLDPGLTLISQGKGTDKFGSFEFVAGQTYGERMHQLTVDELAEHGHTASCSTDGLHSHTFSALVAKNNQHEGGSWNGSFQTEKTSEDGEHSHTITIANTGGNAKHENRMPYIVINRWKRTA